MPIRMKNYVRSGFRFFASDLIRYEWPCGLVVWFLLRVQEVPISLIGRAQFSAFFAPRLTLFTHYVLHDSLFCPLHQCPAYASPPYKPNPAVINNLRYPSKRISIPTLPFNLYPIVRYDTLYLSISFSPYSSDISNVYDQTSWHCNACVKGFSAFSEHKLTEAPYIYICGYGEAFSLHHTTCMGKPCTRILRILNNAFWPRYFTRGRKLGIQILQKHWLSPLYSLWSKYNLTKRYFLCECRNEELLDCVSWIDRILLLSTSIQCCYR